MSDDNPGRFARIWKEWLRSFLMIVLVITSFRSAVADWNDVPTGSMKPTILVGDRIFVNKLAYDLHFPFTRWRLLSWSDPERGENAQSFLSPIVLHKVSGNVDVQRDQCRGDGKRNPCYRRNERRYRRNYTRQKKWLSD